MRITHCDFGRDWRGGQQQLLLLAQALARRGCEQRFVVGGAAVAARIRAAGLAVERAGLKGALALGWADVMHAHDGRAHGWMLAAGGWARGTRVLTRRVPFAIGSGVGRWKMRRLDLAIAVSEAVRHELLAAGVAAARIAVIPDGIDLDALPPPGAGAQLRQRLGIDAGETCLVCLGAFTPEKGVEDLIEALADLRGCRLLLGGQGPGRAGLDARAQALGVADRIVHAGGEPPAELVAAGDVFVMPSRQEGLGSALLLAMALERPIVASRVGGIPELVADEQTGLLTPAADPPALAAAVKRLLATPALGVRLAAAARLAVRPYGIGDVAERTLAAYEKASAAARR